MYVDKQCNSHLIPARRDAGRPLSSESAEETTECAPYGGGLASGPIAIGEGGTLGPRDFLGKPGGPFDFNHFHLGNVRPQISRVEGCGSVGSSA